METVFGLAHMGYVQPTGDPFLTSDSEADSEVDSESDCPEYSDITDVED